MIRNRIRDNMIEELYHGIASLDIADNLRRFVYKKDRADIYKVVRIIEDTLTLSSIAIFDVVEVNCYPDNDW